MISVLSGVLVESPQHSLRFGRVAFGPGGGSGLRFLLLHVDRRVVLDGLLGVDLFVDVRRGFSARHGRHVLLLRGRRRRHRAGHALSLPVEVAQQQQAQEVESEKSVSG